MKSVNSRLFLTESVPAVLTQGQLLGQVQLLHSQPLGRSGIGLYFPQHRTCSQRVAIAGFCESSLQLAVKDWRSSKAIARSFASSIGSGCTVDHKRILHVCSLQSTWETEDWAGSSLKHFAFCSGPVKAVRTGGVVSHATGQKHTEGNEEEGCRKAWDQAVRVLHLHAQESQRSDALFQDPVSGAFIQAQKLGPEDSETASTAPRTAEQWQSAVATRYVDDTVLDTVGNQALNVKQVVILSAGVETRPYRLSWPASTVFFEVAPAAVLSRAQALAKTAGVSIPRGRMLVRVAAEWRAGGEHWAKLLSRNAYQGTRPSIWVLHGTSDFSPDVLVDLLLDIGDLAHVHTILVGRLPTSALPLEAERGPEAVASRLFAEYGFSFESIDRRKLAKQYGLVIEEGSEGGGETILFRAVQTRLSQAQVEALQPQIESMEEDRDGEEGFEDLW